MKTRNTLVRLITITMAVAALPVIVSGQVAERAGAGGQIARRNGSDTLIFPPIGCISGQRLSYSFFNPNEEGSEPVLAQVTLYDSQGKVLARSREEEVPPRQFRTFDFNCDDLPLIGGKPGERKAAAIGLIVGGAAGAGSLAVQGSKELVDNDTGKTTIYYSPPGTRSILR